MSNFVKSSLTVDGDSIHLSLPFSKVNQEKRTVSGYATLDNIDSQGDVVTAEASKAAFERARGNLREMHDKVAVGKIVDFREDEYYDSTEKKFYRGIYVTAYVSKGAQNTWEKVLDGTLSGFSIGGEINEASNEFVKDANNGEGGKVRFIKDYDLVELSLVDNPANQLANVFSIQKSATGSVTVKGMVADTMIETVFICKQDGTVQVKASETAECPVCETTMENAGWFESGVGDRAEKVNELVTKFLSSNDAEATPESHNSEGGVEMFKKEKKEAGVPEGKPVEGPVDPSETFPTGEKVDETTEADDKESESVDETAGTEEEEESASVEEVEEDDQTKIEKKIDELHEAVKDSLDSSREETKEHIEALKKRMEEIGAEFTEKASELEKKLNGFGEKLEATKSRQAELEKSLEALNSSEAFKKSAELEDEPAEKNVQKSTWNGAFSGNRRFSVNDRV